MLLNCGIGEDSWKSLGLQGGPTIHPKGDQSWVFIGRTDAEAETPIFWPPDVKNWLIGKDLDAGKDWRWEKKGMTEDKMVGWHTNLMDMSFSKLWELVMDREAWSTAIHGVTKGQIQVSDWTELNWNYSLINLTPDLIVKFLFVWRCHTYLSDIFLKCFTFSIVFKILYFLNSVLHHLLNHKIMVNFYDIY